ncbi:hypothetical protein ACWKSR_09315 [Campylobacter fetus subsp. venerealis]|uniref:hypothetical protein n=1 Tax=Campylobacter fetus TaxID=196 RepID=UPI0003D82ADA|nr:hypothetical protein [Campylobacter fetus]AHE95287.1 hypothetical protein CFVI03293_B0038 [Campylobacter fetus subsp. venerealis cfvi03/293]OCS23623.1 hypothetical protein CFVI9825_08150 [Campylobacter fetus subsp. venerealis cfvi9825]
MQKKNTLPIEITKIKTEIARDLGLSRATLYLWKNTRPKLYEIIMQYYGVSENIPTQDEQKNKNPYNQVHL